MILTPELANFARWLEGLDLVTLAAVSDLIHAECCARERKLEAYALHNLSGQNRPPAA